VKTKIQILVEDGKPTKIRTTRYDDEWVDDMSPLIGKDGDVSKIVEKVIGTKKAAKTEDS